MPEPDPATGTNDEVERRGRTTALDRGSPAEPAP
jgi:hypothetical protein